jgi:hypothetical protein
MSERASTSRCGQECHRFGRMLGGLCWVGWGTGASSRAGQDDVVLVIAAAAGCSELGDNDVEVSRVFASLCRLRVAGALVADRGWMGGVERKLFAGGEMPAA